MQEQQYIDRFRIERRLGKGAQGNVYLGVDEQLARKVAIKTLEAGGVDEDSHRTALARAAKAVSELEHPNIVALYDIGVWRGTDYLVFEHAAGDTLSARMQGAPMPVPVVLKCMCDLLGGLVHAHAAGVVHRDIKPANITFDDRDNARLMDFGVGQRLPAANGAPDYLAPEIRAGENATPLSDIFALGVVMFEMLTGRHPTNDKAAGEQAVAAPSTLRPDLDPALDRIVVQALAGKPSERFTSAKAMDAAIRASMHTPPQPDAEPAKTAPALSYLMRKLQSNKDFPAFAGHISEINRLTSPDSDATIVELTNSILKDYSLTNKLLRLVNSSMYCQFGGKITTVSRAITIIGFENIRTLAIGLMLFDQVRQRPKARQLLEANLWSFVAAGMARNLAATQRGVEGEPAFISALLARFGMLLAIFYLPDEFDEICRVMQLKGIDQNAASRLVLGVDLNTLGAKVAEHLRFPQLLVDAMKSPDHEKLKTGSDAQQNTVNLAWFAGEVGDALQGPDGDRDATLRELLLKYEDVVDIDDEGLRGLIDDNMRDALALIEVPEEWRKDIESKLRAIRAGGQAGEATPEVDPIAEPGPPEMDERESRSDALLLGINEITNMLVAGHALNDVLGTILEVAYRVLDVQRVLLFVNDMRTRQVAARFGMGAVDEVLLKKLRFSLKDRNALHSAIERGEDVLIECTLAEQEKIPDWYRKHAQAATCALLPIWLNEKLIGVIYADAAEAHAIGTDAFQHLKTLRNQAALAVSAQRKR